MNDQNIISRDFFYNYVSKCMELEPTLDFYWNNDNTEITIRKKSEEGFDVILRSEDESIFIESDIGWHDEFDTSEKRLEWLMGVARDLLSRNMRIKVFYSNGNPYKWIVELYENSEWNGFLIKQLFIWNIFGKKSEIIYTNDVLPQRNI